MRTAIATVSISGDFKEKLAAIAAAGFDGIEIFENDFLAFDGSPRDAGRLVREHGLEIMLFQPFRDFAELGERAARRGLRVGFEALAWGRYINDHRDAWEVVRRTDHPNVGLVLDSFHTLARKLDPESIRSIPGDRIFFVQIADAPMIDMDLLYWSRRGGRLGRRELHAGGGGNRLRRRHLARTFSAKFRYSPRVRSLAIPPIIIAGALVLLEAEGRALRLQGISCGFHCTVMGRTFW